VLAPQLFLQGLDLALQARDLLVLVVNLRVGRLELGAEFLNELVLVGDPVLERDDLLSQLMVLVLGLLEGKVDLILQLGQMRNLVQQ